jgi:hypothetical protein
MYQGGRHKPKGQEKNKKKFQKPLDKKPNLWYNNNVEREGYSPRQQSKKYFN